MRSRYPGDILNWLKDIVESCETIEQTFTASKCLDNFRRNNIIPIEYKWKVRALREMLDIKRLNIRNKNRS
jgi:hypothetical protein